MQPEPNPPPPLAAPSAASVPPQLPSPPASTPGGGRSGLQQLIVALLSVCAVLFLADAVVSTVDCLLILLFRAHVLGWLAGPVFVLMMLVTAGVYLLMGAFPAIPKRVFLPITLFNPVCLLLIIPGSIYLYRWLPAIGWGVSLFQLFLGLALLRHLQGGSRLRWPFVKGEQIPGLRFNGVHLLVFGLVNVFVLLPAAGLYLAACASRAVDHFSDGFLALRPGGLTVQVRKYTRDDGKMVQLIPMSHIGDSAFYRELWQSFPSNSTILMEGVSDQRHLLTNKISYHRVAKSLGLSEQQEEFRPVHGEVVRADVDVEVFASSTIEMLNAVMAVYAQGINPQSMMKLLQLSPPPEAQERLLEDLLATRNRHLLEEIRAHLPTSDYIIVPWGALHIPEIAREIEKSGFRVSETREFTAIRFGSGAGGVPLPAAVAR